MDTFEEFVAARGSALLRTGWLLTGSVADAEDLVQTALLTTHGNFDRIVNSGGSYEAYVRRSMHNRLVSWHRRRRRPRAAMPVGGAADEMAAVDTRDAMRRALSGLSPRQREAIVLRFYEDMTLEDTARAMKCSPGTVKSHVHRGVEALRASGILAELAPSTRGVDDD